MTMETHFHEHDGEATRRLDVVESRSWTKIEWNLCEQPSLVMD